ncbi:ankyrin repeat-containing domain protein [Chaetomium fimeti]|uniref:Ankyrin repeat-containing domain protein n=1 Tax=Chaetomium fimeti TaxID=1854472 RepID=A0AAE0LX35_9PEZI|nr:ankyrin repeat-containing domain protein [Chaetomium fimeti]
MIKALLEGGAEVDSKDSSGRTPLSLAAEHGYEAVAKLLLENGAEIDLKDAQGYAPIDWAAKGGHVAVSKLLGR